MLRVAASDSASECAANRGERFCELSCAASRSVISVGKDAAFCYVLQKLHVPTMCILIYHAHSTKSTYFATKTCVLRVCVFRVMCVTGVCFEKIKTKRVSV